MRRSSKYVLLACALGAVVVLGGLLGMIGLRAYVVRRNCFQQLRAMSTAVYLYRQEHGDQLPPSLAALADSCMPDDPSFRSIFRCPGCCDEGGNGRGNEQSQWYVFIDWSGVSGRFWEVSIDV